MTTAIVRETEAEAVAFIVGQAVGLEIGNASSDYIQLYKGNAALLAESLEVVQRTSAAILGAITVEESISQNAPTEFSQEISEPADSAPAEPRRARRSRPQTTTTEAAP
jgi:DNA transposition AAA+ family ATPase